MIRDHLAAVRALLEPLAEPPAGTPIYEGSLDDEGQTPVQRDGAGRPVTPYVLLSTDSMPLASDRLAQWSNALRGRLYVTCSGRTLAEVQWAQEHTRQLLLDVRPAVAGRQASPLSLDDGQPVQLDRDATPPLLYAVDVYRLTSHPAPTA